MFSSSDFHYLFVIYCTMEIFITLDSLPRATQSPITSDMKCSSCFTQKQTTQKHTHWETPSTLSSITLNASPRGLVGPPVDELDRGDRSISREGIFIDQQDQVMWTPAAQDGPVLSLRWNWYKTRLMIYIWNGLLVGLFWKLNIYKYIFLSLDIACFMPVISCFRLHTRSTLEVTNYQTADPVPKSGLQFIHL